MKLDQLVSPPKGMELDDWSMAPGNFDEIAYFNEWAANDGFDPYSTWSVTEAAGRMDDPIPGTFDRLVYNTHWGPKAVDGKLWAGMTWGDLWKVADAVILQSGDSYHVFIEAFHIEGDQLVLQTGS